MTIPKNFGGGELISPTGQMNHCFAEHRRKPNFYVCANLRFDVCKRCSKVQRFPGTNRNLDAPKNKKSAIEKVMGLLSRRITIPESKARPSDSGSLMKYHHRFVIQIVNRNDVGIGCTGNYIKCHLREKSPTTN